MNIFSHSIQLVALVLVGIFVGIGLGVYLRKKYTEVHKRNIEIQGRQLIEKAIREAEQIKKAELAEIAAPEQG